MSNIHNDMYSACRVLRKSAEMGEWVDAFKLINLSTISRIEIVAGLRLRVNIAGRAVTHLVHTVDSSRQPVKLLAHALFRLYLFVLVLVLQLYPSQCGPCLIFYIIALHK